MGKLILVVDDEYDIASTIELLLTMEGYEVVIAINGKEAMQKLQSGLRPDLIMCDLMMPVMNGYDFIKGFRQISDLKSIPIILTSAAPLQEHKLPTNSWTAFIRKPFNLDDLLDTIKAGLA